MTTLVIPAKAGIQALHFRKEKMDSRQRHSGMTKWVVAFLFGLGISSSWAADNFSQKFNAHLDLLLAKEPVQASGDDLISIKPLTLFYAAREFRPAWVDRDGASEAAVELIGAISKADREGLNPSDYHLTLIKSLSDEIQKDNIDRGKIPESKLYNLDLLLTDAFLTYGSHLLSGRVNPTDLDDDWFANRRSGNLPTLLETAFETNSVRDMLKSLFPTQEYYSQLRVALDRYRTIEKNGGWEIFPKGVTVKKGMNDPRLAALRDRLIIEGDLKPDAPVLETLDGVLEKGLLQFQVRHGIDNDGALGTDTVKALNVSVSDRIRQITLNIERCRWLPEDLGARHIVVNVANFDLDVVENNESVLTMKVVVGRPFRKTPVFSSTMAYIVLCPDWTVPKKIAGLDILEHIREQPDYLKKMGFTVYKGYDDDAPVVDPSTIDFSKLKLENLEYKFKQAPGPLNALGRIKFIFPNKFDVYLHDTPSRELFKKTVRNFSSGCIRIEKPLELAEYLMQSSQEWDKAALEKALKKNQQQFVSIPQPILVHLLYWTAWVDHRGRVQFRDDIYGRDAPLEAAMEQALENQ